VSKQTFTTGQVLTAAQVNTLQSNDFNQTVSVKTAAHTLVVGDRGTRVEFNTSGSVTCTVNSGIFDAGDTLVVQNRGAGAVTVTAGTATVNTEGSLVVNQYGSAILYFISASAAILFAGAAGDITAVNAGTGISGGGSSGSVTITNSMATEIDAKGDLIVGTGADTFARLAVGTNGHTLVADSSVSPTGLKWAAVSAPAFNGAQVKKSAAQSTGAGAVTTITFDQENYDTNSYHDNALNNSRLTVPTTGYYRFTINTGMANYPVGVNEFLQIRLLKNGTQVQGTLSQYQASFDAQATANDYFEFAYYNDLAQSLNGTFSVQFLGA